MLLVCSGHFGDRSTWFTTRRSVSSVASDVEGSHKTSIHPMSCQLREALRVEAFKRVYDLFVYTMMSNAVRKILLLSVSCRTTTPTTLGCGVTVTARLLESASLMFSAVCIAPHVPNCAQPRWQTAKVRKRWVRSDGQHTPHTAADAYGHYPTNSSTSTLPGASDHDLRS